MTEFRRSRRAGQLALSEIVRISEAARALRAEGRDVLTFGTGEPDFPTPRHVIDAAHQAALNGETTYPPTQGTPALRKAIAESAGFTADPAEVMVSTGAKQVIANAFLATLDPGDEVILPAPYYVAYIDMVKFTGGKAVIVPCGVEQDFKISPEQLEAAITPKTKWNPGELEGGTLSAARET